MTTIKITELTDIGANLASSTVLPVVNMSGTPTTQKTVLGNIANVILGGAGGNYVAVGAATVAGTVTTNAQPNITSTGSLTGLTVSNAAGTVNFSNTANVTLGAVGNLHIAGGTAGQLLSTNGNGTLSWASDTTTYGNSNVVSLMASFGSNTITTTGNITGGNINIPNGYANVIGTANIVGGGATVATKSVLNVASTFGSNDANDPASAQAVRGRITGANLTKTRNYVTGVTGQYLVTGTNASEFIKAGILGVVGDQTTTADGAVVAYLDGDGGLTTANAAYAVSMKNSTPNSGFNYGLDLQFINLNVAGTTTTFKQADIRFNNGVTLVANTANNISINANVTAGNVLTSAQVIANGIIESGTGISTGGYLSVNGNTDLHDTTVTGNLSATGNITATNLGNIVAVNLTGSNSNVLYGNGVFAAVAGGNANTGNVTFNDINIIGTGNLKLQPDSANASAYLDIFLTAGPDIHIAGNGETVILGTDDFANVAVNVDGNVSIQAGDANGTHTWTFGTDGSLTLPIGVSIDYNGNTQYPKIIADSGKLFSVQGQGNTGSAALAWTVDPNAASQYASVGVTRLGDNLAKVILQAQSDSGNVATAKTWQFSETGNLTLPGNTFAVNYANGTQVSISGGGNTGNVTFDDNIVIGTGDEFGAGGLYLAVGPDSIANGTVQYLRVRGGDAPTHIHLDTGNNQFYDQYFGDDTKYVKLELGEAGNVVVGTDDDNGNLYSWSFTSDGNLILADGNSVIQSIANSSLDILNPNVSTMVLTPDSGYNSQALVLDPTATGHIHLRAPGANIDEPSANIFLGGEASSFEVGYYNGAAPNLFIHSNNNTWTFDIDGNITFPRDGSNISTDPYLKILGGPNPLILSEDASLAGPANLAIVTDYLNLSGSAGEKIAFHADDGLIATDYDMVLTTNVGGGNTYTWTLDSTGNLNLPGNLVIAGNANVFGTNSSLLQTTDNRPLIALSSGANGAVSSLWVEDIGNVGTSNIAAVYANPTSGSKIVRIAVGQNGGGGPNLWDFGTTGILTLPQGSQISETANTSVNITANANTWAFGVDGNLTVPGSIINDTSIVLSAPAIFNICTIATAGSGYNTGSSLKATTGGSGTGMTVGIGYGLSNQLTSVSVVNPGTGYVNGDVITVSEGTGGTFVITKYNVLANQTNNNTVQTDLIFANNTLTIPVDGNLVGNLIVPGSIVGSGASPAPYISGFSSANFAGNVTANYFLGNGSQLTSLPAPTVTPDISSNGDMSIMTYDGVIRSVNYATVEPSSGNIKGGNISATGNISANNFTGNGGTLSNVATKTSGSWTLASGVNTVNISVPLNGTYALWVNGNIPNGIITYTATAVITNTNVPVLGEQYAWYYAVGNALVFTSIPDQFVGTVGSISNVNTYAGNTANVFTFGITNNSGNTAVVNYGYTKL